MNSNKITFISADQFGYLSDYFYYCKYLSSNYKVSFIGREKGKSIIDLTSVNILNYKRGNNKYLSFLFWLIYIARYSKRNRDTIIYIAYFRFVFILRLLSLRTDLILDIRSGSVTSNKISRRLNNRLLRFETLFFKNVTILSESLIKQLNLNQNKVKVVPLGSEALTNKIKDYHSLKLLYVGSLKEKRKIEDTIKGFAVYINQFNNIDITYDIIGYCSKQEEKSLLDTIIKYNMSNFIKYHGTVYEDKLIPFFEKCNIGVSHIPIIEMFENQPPTKTFQYILSGLICIATNTYENQRLITNDNGILYKDNPQSFANSIHSIYEKRDGYNTDIIRKTLTQYSWNNIIEKSLDPFIKSVINGR